MGATQSRRRTHQSHRLPKITWAPPNPTPSGRPSASNQPLRPKSANNISTLAISQPALSKQMLEKDLTMDQIIEILVALEDPPSSSEQSTAELVLDLANCSECEVSDYQSERKELKQKLVTRLHTKLGGGVDTCAICFTENIKGYKMPCCGRVDSDLAYCRRCLEIVARDYSGSSGDGSVGTCPTCRKMFRTKIIKAPLKKGNDGVNADSATRERLNLLFNKINDHASDSNIKYKNAKFSDDIFCIEAHVDKGRCPVCCQDDKILVSANSRTNANALNCHRKLCQNCMLGQSYCFRYECQKCKKTQKIPHPMFMYQQTPEDYSSATWACHQRCGEYTHWKIVWDDLRKVPAAHCPATWLAHVDRYLAQVRREAEVRRERENLSDRPNFFDKYYFDSSTGVLCHRW